MKFNFFIFLIVLSFHLIPISTASATVDGGKASTLIGFMGKNQEHALILIADIQDEALGNLYAVSLSAGQPTLKNKVDLDDGVNKGDLDSHLGLRTNKDFKAVWQYYVNKLPAGEKTQYTPFVARPQELKYKMANVKYQKNRHTPSSLNLLLENKETLLLKLNVIKEFTSSRFYDHKNKVYCIGYDDNLKPFVTCSSCQLKDHATLCEKKPGKIVRPYIPDYDKNTTTGKTCECSDKGFVMTPEITYKNKTSLGQSFILEALTRTQLQMEQTFTEKYDHKPAVLIVEQGELTFLNFYKNNKDQLIMTGSFSVDTLLNGTYYPALAIF